jgi:hypothetical protein
MSDERAPSATRPLPHRPRAGWIVVAAIAVALLAFFWTPIALWRTHSYTTADVSQDYSLTNVTPEHAAGNQLLSDPAVEMQPWILFARQEFERGKLPLWNPYNAGGQPLLANYQSGILSVFNTPFYFAPFKLALVVSAMAKLAALLCFTYLFLREIELDRGPALIGALGFAFCGHNILLLAYPHAGAAMTLPAGLFFVERTLRRARVREPIALTLVGLAIVIGLGALAGHPEPFGFALVAIALYVAARLALMRREVPPWKLGALCAASIVGGVAIGAVQIVPFVEYFANSTLRNSRFHGQVALDARHWPLWFFPDLLGNPSTTYQLAWTVPSPNYEAANTVYVGPILLFAAVTALVFARRDWRIAFFGLFGLVWWVAIHNGAGLLQLLDRLPGGGAVPLNRSQIFGGFCASALAALTAQHLSRAQGPARRRAWVAASILASAAILIYAARRGAGELLQATLDSLEWRQGTPAEALQHVNFMTWTFAAGAVVLAVLLVNSASWAKHVALGALAAIAFVQSGWLLRNYNSVSEDRYVFPRTEAVRALQHAVGDGTLMRIGEDSLTPETNIVYGIRMIAGYDAMWIAPRDELVQIDLATRKNWRPALWASERTLRLLGVTHVLTPDDWIPVDTLFPDSNWAPTVPLERLELGAARTVIQTFTCDRDGLEGVAVYLSTEPGRDPRHLYVVIDDAADGRVLMSKRLNSHVFLRQLDNNWRPVFPSDVVAPVPGRLAVFRFPAERSSKGRVYRIKLTAVREEDRDGWCTWVIPEQGEEPENALSVDGVQRAGRLLFDASASLHSFEEISRPAAHRLWRYRSSTGRAWIVHGVRTVLQERDALGVVLSEPFNPMAQVVLVGSEEKANWGRANGGDSVRFVGDRTKRWELEVELGSAGYLVTNLPWFPGWKARVDGAAAPIVRANYAFQAVPVARGKHRVELVYQPASFWIGAAISALTAAVLTAVCVRARLAAPA